MKDFIDFLKLPSYLLGALAVASGILLFAPDEFIRMLYMDNFRDTYGFTIGIVFIVSVSILAVLVLKLFCRSVSRRHNSKKLKENQEKYLLTISSEKVELINAFLQQPTHTLKLPVQDGLVIELQYYNVITPAGATHLVSMPDPQINFFLQPWVVERIKENKDLQRRYYH